MTLYFLHFVAKFYNYKVIMLTLNRLYSSFAHYTEANNQTGYPKKTSCDCSLASVTSKTQAVPAFQVGLPTFFLADRNVAKNIPNISISYYSSLPRNI